MGVVCIPRRQTFPDDMMPSTPNVFICSLLKTKLSFGLAFFLINISQSGYVKALVCEIIFGGILGSISFKFIVVPYFNACLLFIASDIDFLFVLIENFLSRYSCTTS